MGFELYLYDMHFATRHIIRILVYLFLAILACAVSSAETLGGRCCEEISACLTRFAQREIRKCPVSVVSTDVRNGLVTINASTALSYFPIRPESLSEMKDSIRRILPSKYRNMRLDIVSEGHNLAFYIPRYYSHSSSVSRTYGRKKSGRKGKKASGSEFGAESGTRLYTNSGSSSQPLVRHLSYPYNVTMGLSGRHIAIWQSHGRYFNQNHNQWQWQRSLLWQTVEDLYTQSYVLPFLVPMLENAGANVLLPRERDFSSYETISDNDPGIDSLSSYRETNGTMKWQSGGPGFAHRSRAYTYGQNPFRTGTSRSVSSIHSPHDTPSTATWTCYIPSDGEYAVYVSYPSFETSAPDATYTVCHDGKTDRISVNQRMGGDTWIYLGSYFFRKGGSGAIVSLSNVSSVSGSIVSADAVKIGGGMGNIARNVCDSVARCTNQQIGAEARCSGMPRFCEGSRYFLQWAGYDPDVYSPKCSGDDYKDDFMSRSRWVNEMMGGSERLSDSVGKGIPIDMSLAFHTDAGITSDSTTIGTLGIFFTKHNNGLFDNSISRYVSRDLTDVVMSQIVGDIRKTFDRDWSRRGMWNRSYYEARVPEVPAMLLELLSHQNLSDMAYGHDPRFKFTVCRSIYKGILRHLSAQNSNKFVVQPLPVESLCSSILDFSHVRLKWSAKNDPLEKTATPKYYILYTRVGDGGFDGGRVVKGTEIIVEQKKDVIYSYKVVAANDGGISFPSEIVSSCISSNARGNILVVNGFDRISAPEVREDGFHNEFDSGVPYIRDVSFIGCQRVFDVEQRNCKDELLAFGCSMNDQEGKIVGGNTYDYPYLYGRSIVSAGYSFCSSSRSAIESNGISLDGADMVICIFGKQRAIDYGYDDFRIQYRCFTRELKSRLEAYLASGGKVMVSGSYLAYDLMASSHHDSDDERFATDVLHFRYMESSSTCKVNGMVWNTTGERFNLMTGYRPDTYTLDSIDAIYPSGSGTRVVMSYFGSRLPAVTVNKDNGTCIVMGFPFEMVDGDINRNQLMERLIDLTTN